MDALARLEQANALGRERVPVGRFDGNALLGAEVTLRALTRSREAIVILIRNLATALYRKQLRRAVWQLDVNELRHRRTNMMQR